MTDHPPRKEVEESFVEYAKEVIERRGTLLVPAFSVGRAQEIACILRAASFPHPVYMDGMALKANEIFFRYQEYLKDPEHFRKSIEYLELVTSWSQRRKIVKTPCVIIAPAGMLVGGAAVFYQAKVSKSSRNAISLVAFQIPGTPGRTLLDKGMALVNGRPRKVKCEVKRFDFSSHSGRKELFEFFGDMKGSPKVLTIHGEPESCVKFAEELNKKYGFEAYAPQPGETYKI